VFINLVGFGIVIPLLPFYGQTLDAPPWQVALMFSAYSLGQFVAEPFWGRLSDRIGRKPVLMITILANAAGYLALAFVPNIWLAIGVRLFTGLGAGNVSTAQGYVADVTPPELRAGRMGLIGAAFGLGFIFGPAIGGLLTRPDLGPLGYQLPIFTASGLCVLAALGVAFLLKESRVRADAATPRPPFLGGVHDAVANPVVSRVLLVTLIYMAGFSGMESTFGFWTEARYGWTAREVGLCFMAVGIVSVICQGFLAGRLARRFGESRVLAVGCLVFGAGPGGSGGRQSPAARLGLAGAGDHGGRCLRHGDDHAQYLGPDLALGRSRPSGGHAGAEHGLKLDRTHLRPHDRRRHLFADRARLALPDRRSPDHSGGGDGDQRRESVPQAAGHRNFAGSLAASTSSRLAISGHSCAPGEFQCSSVSKGPVRQHG
jgi:MFS family permease